MSTAPAEVFLSHAIADQPMAKAIADTIRRHGVPVWYSADSLVGSQIWQEEIGRAINRCDWFVVLVTEQAAHSMWVPREAQYALGQRRLLGRITAIVPSTTDAEAVAWGLATVQQIRVSDHAGYCREILRMWGIGLDASKLVLPGDPS